MKLRLSAGDNTKSIDSFPIHLCRELVKRSIQLPVGRIHFLLLVLSVRLYRLIRLARHRSPVSLVHRTLRPAAGPGSRRFFTAVGPDFCLAQRIVDFHQLIDQLIETTVLLQMVTGGLQGLIRD